MHYAKEAFIAAVAACALIAFVSPTHAQDHEDALKLSTAAAVK